MPLPQVLGLPRSFDKKFKFQVLIAGIISAEFQKCSDLEIELAVVEHHQGGALTPNKSPGRMTFPNITLERGAVFDIDLLLWFNSVAVAAAGLGIGLKDPFYKRVLEIQQLDRDNTIIRRYVVFGVWPKKYSAGSWDNTVDEVRIESVELVVDSWVRIF